MVGVSVAEGIEPGGTYREFNGDTAQQRQLPDNYRPALSEDVPEGRACGNCFFYNDDRVSPEGDRAWCEKWSDFVRGDYYCNAWQPDDSDDEDEPDYEDELEERDTCEDCTGNCQVCQPESRQVNLTPPAYMRAAARQGLRYYEEGKAGDGLVERTVREARAMAAGNVTADKWVRIAAWIARHMADLDAPAANPNSDDYPSAGVVAHLLWGSGPSKASARRAMEYAQGVVARIEEENEGRAKGEALSKIETRVNTTQFEIREEAEGMRFSGYAAVFDSPSEPLPFIERIARGAFKKTLRSRNDVKFLWNHDSGEILGSTRAKTLTLYEDERGLKVEGILPNTSRGRDVAELLKRGDVDSMSFGFSVPAGGDSWSTDGSERTLKSVRLHEVSLVAFPAYPGTAGLQSVRGLDKVAERAGVDADALADALLKIEDGQAISADEKDMLSRVISDLSPETEAKVDENHSDLGMLMLKKKKLDLLTKGVL
jgi:HK97 family phage prohead protease